MFMCILYAYILLQVPRHNILLESAQNSNSYTIERQVKQKQKADPKKFPDMESPDPPQGQQLFLLRWSNEQLKRSEYGLTFFLFPTESSKSVLA